ncbi:MAG: hypothetical protein LBJ26_19355 [Paenibacillus sp.]|jgi:hypothetical protein|nr:hypothetical protein [Paenibacillus sp.]
MKYKFYKSETYKILYLEKDSKKRYAAPFSLSFVPESLNGNHHFRVPLGWLTLSPELRPATVPCT